MLVILMASDSDSDSDSTWCCFARFGNMMMLCDVQMIDVIAGSVLDACPTNSIRSMDFSLIAYVINEIIPILAVVST